MDCFDIMLTRTRLDITFHLISVQRRALYHPDFPQASLGRTAMMLCLINADFQFWTRYSFRRKLYHTIVLVAATLGPHMRKQVAQTLKSKHRVWNEHLSFLFGPSETEEEKVLHLEDMGHQSKADSGSLNRSKHEEIGTLEPFCLRRWELVQDATPAIGENDASPSLALFGAKKSEL